MPSWRCSYKPILSNRRLKTAIGGPSYRRCCPVLPKMAANLLVLPPFSSSFINTNNHHTLLCSSIPSSSSSSSSSSCIWFRRRVSLCVNRSIHSHVVFACLPSSSASSSRPTRTASTKLYISGLSFRTTEENLRNAFQNFGHLIEVNLVMDKIANRPRGFAFIRYATEEESTKAIEGMHGKFLDGRVIFVEVAKSKWELRDDLKKEPRRYQ